jgi:tripartite-type tricarboxylate transporter receptor subunit TctC
MKGEVAAADRRGVLRASLALAAAAILNLDPAAAQDENFPSRTISMVTHAGPGGGTDITTRMMMVIARAELGQELVVLNKTGGSGVAALQYAMSQPRDGYTVLTITQSHIFQILQEKVPLKVDDLVGIARATLDPQIIAVRADSPIKDLKGLIEASKAKPAASSGAPLSSAARITSPSTVSLRPWAAFPTSWCRSGEAGTL